MSQPVNELAHSRHCFRLLVRRFVRVALFVLFACWSPFAFAQCVCSLPANQPCLPGCATCIAQPVSCTCTTPCTFLDATCNAGYQEVTQSGIGCGPGFVTATCRLSGVQSTSACATCLPGRYGTSCLECPGGASNSCNGHGTCSQGISGTGACVCAQGYSGPACEYSSAVDCNGHGLVTQTGACLCDVGFTGASCNTCEAGYFGYPSCRFCSAAITCSGHGACSGSGDCVCASGFTGPNCGSCAAGYYGYPNCRFCDAATTCNAHGLCDPTGFCACEPEYAGAGCDACATDHYDYPDCVACQGGTTCSGHGQCAADGSCVCDPGFTGANCLECGATTVEMVCDDGVDTDCDRAIDCEDTDCCTAGVCAWADGDGDTYVACDCDDANPLAWGTPGEVPGLTVKHAAAEGARLTWSPPSQPGGNPALYDLLRFDDPRDFDGTASCLALSNPTFTAFTDPDPLSIGRAFFYLVRARSACPLGTGPLGTDSSGNPRTGTCGH